MTARNGGEGGPKVHLIVALLSHSEERGENDRQSRAPKHLSVGGCNKISIVLALGLVFLIWVGVLLTGGMSEQGLLFTWGTVSQKVQPFWWKTLPWGQS